MSTSSSLPDNDPVAEHLTVVTNTTTSNVASPVPSDIEAMVCRRAEGKVCVCELCEATRMRLLHRSNKKRVREDATTTVMDATAALAAQKAIDDDEEAAHTAKLDTMATACKTILECIGEDPEREGLVKTPQRWAKALMYMCSGYTKTPEQVVSGAVFAENHDEMVVVRNIDIHSLCEHHMVPFTGRVHIGYIPNGKIVGLSKLARIAELYARRLQVQERLTRQIADAVVETVCPLGVAVVVECTHFCMVMRGVQKTAAVTTTSSVRGCFESNSKTRAEFFSIIQGNGYKMC